MLTWNNKSGRTVGGFRTWPRRYESRGKTNTLKRKKKRLAGNWCGDYFFLDMAAAAYLCSVLSDLVSRWTYMLHVAKEHFVPPALPPQPRGDLCAKNLRSCLKISEGSLAPWWSSQRRQHTLIRAQRRARERDKKTDARLSSGIVHAEQTLW